VSELDVRRLDQMISWIRIKDGRIIYQSLLSRKILHIETLTIIKYHYHAVVGFESVWEILDKDGNLICLDVLTFGKNGFFRKLESSLNGFSFEEFNKKFEDGGAVDTIEVWTE
jgi:hypothetical protein